MIWCHGFIIIPPHALFGKCIAYNKLVLRRATSVLAGFDQKRPAAGYFTFAAGQCHFIDFSRAQVPVNGLGFLKPLPVNSIITDMKAALFHHGLLLLPTMPLATDGRLY